MFNPRLRGSTRARSSSLLAVALLIASVAAAPAVSAQGSEFFFLPGTLVVSRSVYTEVPSLGNYPFVWNNVLTDASFGVTSRILLDQIAPWGLLLGSLEVPNSTQKGVGPTKDQLVTSFSSKSELALNLSTDGSAITFMGYVSPVAGIDVSNSNTPGAIDATNPVLSTAYRAVGEVDARGKFRFTETNAYSGNNGRAAIKYDAGGNAFYATAGNAGNGTNPQPEGVVLGAGAQFIVPQVDAEVAQNPGVPAPIGSFSVTQLGGKADKIGKDDNFRGLTLFNNVLYFTKGSGSNGVNTVYFLDTTGNACPAGVGLPASGAALPAGPLAYDPTKVTTNGLPPNMCILAGFPAVRNSALTATTTAYPFGLWFANAKTLYVADEGDGNYGDVGLTPAGLQKWVFDDATQTWNHVYTLQNGLGLGQTYSFTGEQKYPTGVNAATGLPWAPLTDGLRNITGAVLPGGFAAIWGITSTVSGNGDQGADPNKLVAILDNIENIDPTAIAHEQFLTLRTAGFGEVLRGIAFAPGTWLW